MSVFVVSVFVVSVADDIDVSVCWLCGSRYRCQCLLSLYLLSL